jgi:hypothetical protein
LRSNNAEVTDMGRYYILRDDEVIEEHDHTVWSEWFENRYREVADIDRTDTTHSTVRTRFLAVNLTLAHDQPPLLFETSVEGGWLDGQGEKFSTVEQARAGHQSWVEKVRAAESENELPPPGAAW